ncbi:uncharacterized protein LOC129737815 [Uranotaenia lowii]|uniref:uncharacterized protein LOC129737815 n=1 Tax=Uranotaenia lowii TaxID=190385 RepID=UPI00247A408E|nr:uncharacterized protein LOC129737815 [Uranotaenia lowii]
MSKIPFRSKFNWPLEEGDPDSFISHSIQEDAEECVEITQDELLNLESCLVLSTPNSETFCEQSISTNPVYRIVKLALIAECSKIETYLNRTGEYHRTYDGDLIFDGGDGSKLYRFDLDFGKPHNCMELKLRFVAPRNENLCLYGMQLVLRKNGNPMAMFSAAFSQDRGEEMSREELTERMAQLGTRPNHQSLHMFNNHSSSLGRFSNRPDPGTSHGPPSFTEVLLKQYIDDKFSQLEQLLDKKFSALETKQNEKLDRILALLETNNKVVP